MWIKILGAVCAGVFIAAALVEIKQLGFRGKRDKHEEETHEADLLPQGTDGEETSHS